MNATGWWHQALLEWAEATGFKVEFAAYANPLSKRELGEWWLDKGRWNVHLEPLYFARLEPEPDVTVRRTLTWMLSLLRQSQRPTSEMLLTSWVADLLSLPETALDKLVVGEGLLDAPESSWIAKYGSGWLALLTPQYPKTVTLEERAELRQNMRQVISSYVPDGFIGWLNINLATEQTLIFIGEAAMEDSGWTQSVDKIMLRQWAENLLDSISQDVLIKCEIAVGLYLDNSTELPAALLTVALLRRKRRLTESQASVEIWGEQPLHILLKTIPAQGVDWFLRAVDALGLSTPKAQVRADSAATALPEELVTSLQGLVAANLNVSEAARLLFVHRNTLIHRLERIHELTGYDIRNFDDALVLWLAYSLGGTRDTGLSQLD